MILSSISHQASEPELHAELHAKAIQVEVEAKKICFW